MSNRGFFFVRLVGVLLLVGVLVTVGVLAFRTGQAQGYALGLVASGEELSTLPAGTPGFYPAYGFWAQPYFGLMPFWPLLCLFGLGLVFLFALGAIFRIRHWHGYGIPGRYGEPGKDDWSAGWHGWHGSPTPGSQPPVKENVTATPSPETTGSPE